MDEILWEYWIHDTRTGNPVQQVHPSAVTWTARLTARGDARATFELDGSSIPLPANGLLTPSSRCLVVQRGGTVVWAGYLIASDYDRDARSVTVEAKEIRALFDVRSFGAAHLIAPDPTSWDLTISNRSISGAVRAVLNRILTYSPESNLPIDLPADGSGSYTRRVRYWEQVTPTDLFTEIEQQGWEIFFRPYKTSGQLRWQTIVSQRVVRSTVDLPVTAPSSPVTGLHVKTPGDEQLTGVVAVGKGTGPDMLMRGATSNPGGIPARDTKVDAKDIEDVNQLQAVADAAMAEAVGVGEDVSFSVRLGDPVEPSWVLPGNVLRLDATGDPWWSGVHEKRVLAVGGDMGLSVTPEVEE